jgi:hypothetical protein
MRPNSMSYRNHKMLGKRKRKSNLPCPPGSHTEEHRDPLLDKEADKLASCRRKMDRDHRRQNLEMQVKVRLPPGGSLELFEASPLKIRDQRRRIDPSLSDLPSRASLASSETGQQPAQQPSEVLQRSAQQGHNSSHTPPAAPNCPQNNLEPPAGDRGGDRPSAAAPPANHRRRGTGSSSSGRGHRKSAPSRSRAGGAAAPPRSALRVPAVAEESAGAAATGGRAGPNLLTTAQGACLSPSPFADAALIVIAADYDDAGAAANHR